MHEAHTLPQLTVLYCDLVASTRLAERFEPEDLREIVRDYQAVAVAAIDRQGGFTAQYLGDGILACFGYPEPRDDDAERAVRAGLGIVGAIQALNERLESSWNTRLAVRVGIHTGVVATAEVEGTHLIHGPTPHVAALLQKMAEPNGIVVSAVTREHAGEAFPCHPIGFVDDLEAPVEAFWVEATVPMMVPQSTDDEGNAERRQLTVMFCELVSKPSGDAALDDTGSSLSVDLDLETITSVVGEYQSACAAVVGSYGGHVGQYLSEGLLVYFGFPIAHEDAARRAVLAGLEILETVERLGSESAEDQPLTVRLGLHTGPVVAGEVGAGATRERLAVGSAPIVAARLRDLARPGELLVSQTTRQLVEGFFVTEPRGAHRLPGFSESTGIFRVRKKSGVRNPFEVALSRGLTPIQGRQEELATLLASLHRARDGRAEALWIHGEAGIGKSRLLYALQERATGFTQWSCRCSPYAQGSPLEPLIDLFQRILEPEDHAENTERRIRNLEVFLEGLGLLSDEAVTLLAGLLSLPLPPRYPEMGLNPQLQKQKTQELTLEILFQAARQNPLLFVVEDLHWIDPSTQDFLGLLLGRPEGRLLTVLTCRPSYSPSWPEPAVPLVEIPLAHLDREEAAAILRHLTGGKSFPPEVERQVMARADGIPLFVEELVKMLLESGALREGERAYELTRPISSLAIPTSVHDLLTARLDRLSSAKELLQWGAVIGREFTHEMLAAVAELGAEALEEQLETILGTGLVLRQGAPPRATYVFKHALIQDAAYDSLLRRQRRRYHGRVAAVLTERFPEVVAQRPQIVALHFTQAGQVEPAIDHWLLAAQQDFQRAAFGEAADHLQQGLALLEDMDAGPARDNREVALRVTLGSVESSTKGFAAPDVQESFSRALAVCARIGDAPGLFWILYGLWRFHFMRADYQKSLEIGEQLIRLAEEEEAEVGHPDQRLTAFFTVGATLMSCGRFPEAREMLERAIAIDSLDRDHHDAAQTGQDSGVASRCWAAMTLWFLGYPDRARRYSDEALALAKSVGHPFSQTYALTIAGFLAYYRRERESLRVIFAEVVEHARTQGSWWKSTADTFLGWADEDRRLLREGLDAHLASGARLQRPQIFAAFAEVALRQGHAEEARLDLDQAQAAIDETGERYYEPEVFRLRGEASLLDDTDGGARRAEECFRQALAVAGRQESRSLALRASTSLGRLLGAQGRNVEALDVVGRLYASFTEGFDTPDLREARMLLEGLKRGNELV